MVLRIDLYYLKLGSETTTLLTNTIPDFMILDNNSDFIKSLITKNTSEICFQKNSVRLHLLIMKVYYCRSHIVYNNSSESTHCT